MRDAPAIAAVLKTLSDADRDRLQRKTLQFDQLPRPEQRRMRQLHRELSASDDADQLFGVLERYRDWLTSLSAAERDALLSQPTSQRALSIARLKRKQDAQRLASGASLSPKDTIAVGRWFMNYLGRHEAELLNQLPPQSARRIRNMKQTPHRKRLVMELAVKHGLFKDLATPPLDEFDILLERLSPPARAQLASAQSDIDRLAIVRDWVHTGWRNRSHHMRLTREALQQFYETQLNGAQREELDRLPADEMQQRLRQLVIEQRRKNRGMDTRPTALPRSGERGY